MKPPEFPPDTYMVRLLPGKKYLLDKAWQLQRNALVDLARDDDGKGKGWGLLTGALYSGGTAGWLCIDVDKQTDREGDGEKPFEADGGDDQAEPFLDCLGIFGVYIIILERTGGNNRGFRIFLWLEDLPLGWSCPGKFNCNGYAGELLWNGKQAVVAPTVVEVAYRRLETRERTPADLGALGKWIDRYAIGSASSTTKTTTRPLPTDWPTRTKALVVALPARGAVFWTEKREDGGLQGVPFDACPICGGLSSKGARDAHGTAILWTDGGLRCFRASCPAHETMDASTWVRVAWPDDKKLHAIADGCGRGEHVEVQDPKAGMSMADARAALADDVDLAHDMSTADPDALILLDDTAGLGKSRRAIVQKLGLLTLERRPERNAQVLLVTTHELAAELAERAEDPELQAEAKAPKGVAVLHLKGRAQVCKKDGVYVAEARLWTPIGKRPELCRKCEFAKDCKREMGMERLKSRVKRGLPTLVVSVHALAPRIMALVNNASPWFDELSQSQMWQESEPWTAEDLSTIKRGYVSPDLSPMTQKETRDWLRCRVSAEETAAALLKAWAKGRKPGKHRIYGKPGELRKAAGKVRWGGPAKKLPFASDRTLSNTEREAATFEATIRALCHGRVGTWPEPPSMPIRGVHPRADSDDLYAALRDELAGDVGGQRIFPWLDPDGSMGYRIVKPSELLPDGRGAVIMAAGGGLFEAEIKAAWPGRNLTVKRIVARESEHVRRVLFSNKSFDRRRLSDPMERQANAVRSAVLVSLPELARVARIVGRERIIVGIVTHLQKRTMLEKDPLHIEALRPLTDAGCELRIMHYGALEGLNGLSDCDALLIFGDGLPNPGNCALMAEVLSGWGEGQITGEQYASHIIAHQALQVTGRPRGGDRNATSPVVIIQHGRNLAGAEATHKKATESSADAVALELLAARQIHDHGGCTAEMAKALAKQVLEGGPGEAENNTFHLWDLACVRGLFSLSKTLLTRTTFGKYSARTISAALQAAAVADGAEVLALPVIGAGRPEKAYVIPARRAEFDAYVFPLRNETETVVGNMAEIDQAETTEEAARPRRVLPAGWCVVNGGAPSRDALEKSFAHVVRASRRCGGMGQADALRATTLGIQRHLQTRMGFGLAAGLLAVQRQPAPIGRLHAAATTGQTGPFNAALVYAGEPARLPEIPERKPAAEPLPIPRPEPEPSLAGDVAAVEVSQRELLGRTMSANWTAIREYVQERAAVREYDGEQTHTEAEQGALADLANWLMREHGLSGLTACSFETWERQGLFADVERAPPETEPRRARGHARDPFGVADRAHCA